MSKLLMMNQKLSLNQNSILVVYKIIQIEFFIQEDNIIKRN